MMNIRREKAMVNIYKIGPRAFAYRERAKQQ